MIANNEFDLLMKITRFCFGFEYYRYHKKKLTNKNKKKILKTYSEKYGITSNKEMKRMRKEKGIADMQIIVYRDTVFLFARDGKHETEDLSEFRNIRKFRFYHDIYTVEPKGVKKSGKIKYTIKIAGKRKEAIYKNLEKLAFKDKKIIVDYLKKTIPHDFSGLREDKVFFLKMLNKKRMAKNMKTISLQEINNEKGEIVFKDNQFKIVRKKES